MDILAPKCTLGPKMDILAPEMYILILTMYILAPKTYILTLKMYILAPKNVHINT